MTEWQTADLAAGRPANVRQGSEKTGRGRQLGELEPPSILDYSAKKKKIASSIARRFDYHTSATKTAAAAAKNLRAKKASNHSVIHSNTAVK